MALGAQLGVARDELIDFARTVKQLDVLSDLGAEEGATRLAQLRNVLGPIQGDFTQLASAIVATGNSSAATERQIAEFTSRMAGAGRTIGLTGADMVGFGSAVASAGVQAEAGGTALQTVFIEIGKAAAGGGKKLETFARLTGRSIDEFKRLLDTEPAEAVVQVVEALGRLQQAGDGAFQALDFLSFDNARLLRTLLSTAGAGDLLREQIKLANLEFEKGTRTQSAFIPFANTTAKQLESVASQAKNAARELGNGLAPTFRDLLGFATQIIRPLAAMAKGFADSSSGVRAFAIAVGVVVAGIGPLLLLVGKLASVMAIARIASVALAGTGAAGAAAGGLASIGAVLATGGLVLVGLAAAAAAIYLLGQRARDEKTSIEQFKSSLATLGDDQLLRSSQKLVVQLDNMQRRVQSLRENMRDDFGGDVPKGLRQFFSKLGISPTEALDQAEREMELLRQKVLGVQLALQQSKISAADAETQMAEFAAQAAKIGKASGIPDLSGLGEKKPFEKLSADADTAVARLGLLQEQIERTGTGLTQLARANPLRIDTTKALGDVRGFVTQVNALLATGISGEGRDVLLGLRDALLGALTDFQSKLPEVTNQLGQATAQAATAALQTPAVAFASLTGHLVDAAKAYDRAKKAFDVASANEDKAGLRAAQKDLELLQKKIDGIRARLVKAISADGIITDAEKKALADFEAIAAELGVDFKQADKAAGQLKGTMEQMQKIRDIAGGIKDFANIAEQLGLINEETSEAIGNIADLGAGIARIAAGDVLGGLLQGLSGLGGLVGIGESPEEKERNRVNKANTEAIKKLTSEIGNISLDVSGDTFAGLQRAFAVITDPTQFLNKDNTKLGNRVNALLLEFGVSIEDVKRLAEEMGLEFQNTAQFYKDFGAAMQQVELTRFAETFGGQLDLLTRSFDILGIEDPAEKFRQTIELLSSDLGSPAIRDALAGIDLSTAEGIEQAREALRNLFKNFEQLTPEQLGGLTPQQFLDALSQATGLATEALEELLGATEEAVGGMLNVPSGFRIAAARFAAQIPETIEDAMRPIDAPLVNLDTDVLAKGLEVAVPPELTSQFTALADALTQQQLSTDRGLPLITDALDRFSSSIPTELPAAIDRIGKITPPDLLGALDALGASSPPDILAALDAVRQAVALPSTTPTITSLPDLTNALLQLATVTPPDLLAKLDEVKETIAEGNRNTVGMRATGGQLANSTSGGQTVIHVHIPVGGVVVESDESGDPASQARALVRELRTLALRTTGDTLRIEEV